MTLKTELGVPDTHELRRLASRTKGHMGQTEIDEYEEVAPDGTVLAIYTVTEHTQVRGLRTTRSFEKRLVKPTTGG